MGGRAPGYHPRRPRGSQSGRKRRDKSLQVRAKTFVSPFLPTRLLTAPGFFEDAWVPTLTGSFPNGQANAGSWLGTKNCFVLLCPIGEKSSLIAVVYEQRQWRLRKRLLKNEVVLLLALSRLFHFVHFVNCWQFFLELNSERLYQCSGKEIESRCLVFTSSKKGEITQFYVVIVQWRQKNVQKSVVLVQSCCFASLN